MGDDEALSMGIPVGWARLKIITCATLLSAFSVVLAGIVGWIGLVIPHIVRFLVGPDNRVLLPASAMAGAIFLLVTDSIARTVFTAELPLGYIPPWSVCPYSPSPFIPTGEAGDD